MSDHDLKDDLVRMSDNGEKFKVILADPAWTYTTYSDKGKGKSPERHYKCMSIDEICALPVASVADKDCALFMWVTWPLILHTEKIKLADGTVVHDNVINRVLRSWGFEYSGLAWEWIKYNAKTGKYAFGPGRVTRKNMEPRILARKGSPAVKSKSVRDFIIAPRREHSRKPDEQYDRIEALYDGPCLELFSRTTAPGWVASGNQAGRFILDMAA